MNRIPRLTLATQLLYSRLRFKYATIVGKRIIAKFFSIYASSLDGQVLLQLPVILLPLSYSALKIPRS